MRLHPPVDAFIAGAMLSEVYQWARYWSKNTDKPWHAYWKMGLPHALMNLCGDVVLCVLWAYGGLDVLLIRGSAFIPGSDKWAMSGLPYTPECGIALGFFGDLFADNLASFVSNVATAVRDKIPFLKQDQQPAP